jgi:hypothetical protein
MPRMNARADTWGLQDLLDDFEPAAPLRQENPLLADLIPGRDIYLADEHPFDEEPTKSLTLSEWPPQLPVALALQVEDLPHILDRFNLTPERFELLKPLPAFRKAVAEAEREVRETGHTFKLKCKGIAEDFLDTIYLELHNDSVGLSTKVDMFKYLVKMGGLEPIPQKETTGPVGTAVQININLGAPQQAQTHYVDI